MSLSTLGQAGGSPQQASNSGNFSPVGMAMHALNSLGAWNNAPLDGTAQRMAGNMGTGKGSGGQGQIQQGNPAISPFLMQLLQNRLGLGSQHLSQGLFSGNPSQNFNPQSPGMLAQQQQEAQVQQQIAQRQQQAVAKAAQKQAPPVTAPQGPPEPPWWYAPGG